MSHHYLDTMQQVLKLSNDMLELAERASWEEVEALETRRQELLGQHGPLPDGDDAQAAAEVVQQIMQINESLLQLGNQKLSDYMKERGDLSKGRRAVAAYGG